MEFMFKLPRLKMNLKFVQGQSTPSIATQSSNLAVCDLSNLVKPQDIIITEHLTTLLAIVPKYSQKDWLSSYKTLTAYVVPRSSTKLHEDNEYALYTVTLFSRDADNFRTKARDRGFQSIVLAPSVKSEKKARSILEELCDSANRWS
ncbi:V-type proton ATPase subunit C-like isoform X12 [Camellia sinensis]|uniref:V-type proton ATPase subunit C-like isoform X12 n=1 Tax=Camellia sinensis TaxID=4442 RepID=UPI001035F3C4|nr:V-type proton ATPase subunit C-like isoform X12 [Camellia sinensis]